jgi:hypothetical protein
MRKFVTLIGTLLIATILICGSAVALTWYYLQSVVRSEDCTNPLEARFKEDGVHATLGVNTPTWKLGEIMLDLGEGNEMGHDQYFTVFANSSVWEQYRLWIHDDEDHSWGPYEGADDDNEIFKTPPITGVSWRYIEIHGITGASPVPFDPIYGPEIDAVGYEA